MQRVPSLTRRQTPKCLPYRFALARASAETYFTIETAYEDQSSPALRDAVFLRIKHLKAAFITEFSKSVCECCHALVGCQPRHIFEHDGPGTNLLYKTQVLKNEVIPPVANFR